MNQNVIMPLSNDPRKLPLDHIVAIVLKGRIYKFLKNQVKEL